MKTLLLIILKNLLLKCYHAKPYPDKEDPHWCMLMLFWFWCIGSGSEPQGKLVPLGRTQVCLGPVQCHVAVEVGERGFGRDQTLGGTDGFCWKSGFIESGDIRILEKKFG